MRNNKPKLTKPLPSISQRSNQRPVTSGAEVACVKPLLVSRVQAANLLGISGRSLDFLIHHGEVKTRRIGTRVLIVVASLEAYADVDHPDPLATIGRITVRPGDDPDAA